MVSIFDKNYANSQSCVEKIKEILNIERSTIRDNLTKNKEYYKPIILDNILSNILCDYIVTISEEYAKSINGWQTARHRNYPTTDIPTNNIYKLDTIINSIFYYLVFPQIEDNYKVDKKLLSISDSFIVKYDADKQNYLEKHKDGSLFSFSILLNEPTEFDGGGTKFFMQNNEFVICHKKGDCLIHLGQTEHSGNKITKGVRYLLVGFIKYCNFVSDMHKNPNIMLYDFNHNNENNTEIQTFIIHSKLINEINEKIMFFNNFYSQKTFILDIHQEKMCCFEKFIYEMFIFHLKRLNLYDKIDEYYCEYWLKLIQKVKEPILHAMHVDKNEFLWSTKKELETPILATISYLKCDNAPTLITNTNKETFDKKEINLNYGLGIIMPQQFNESTNDITHICFNGSNYHGVYNLNQVSHNFSRVTILFNIWHKKPQNIEFKSLYNNDNNKKLNFYSKNENLVEVDTCNNTKHINVKKIEMYNLLQNVLLNKNPNKTIEFINDKFNKNPELKNTNVIMLTI